MSLSEGKISLEHHLGSGIALDPVAFENKGLLSQLVLKFTGIGLKVRRSELRNSNCFHRAAHLGMEEITAVSAKHKFWGSACSVLVNQAFLGVDPAGC